MKGPICLVVLDGFGLRSDREAAEHDATALADTPFFDRADRLYPRARIETSGLAVGLPEGQMGNSEVGHMTLGAGRIFEHDTVRIQKAFDAGAPRADGTLTGLLEAVREAGNSLHLFGLVSDGGVHSSLGHLEFLIDLLEEHGIAPVLHAFTDGRDTPPRSALAWIQPLEQRLLALGGCIATLSGRYWAMDRDQRWDRIALACRAIVGREGPGAASAVDAIRQGYKRDESDEFILPTVIAGDGPRAFEDGSAGLFFNFRADRARELTNALTRARPDALGAEILELEPVRPGAFYTLTVYDRAFPLPSLFEPIDVSGSLGELVSDAGLRQLRIAETEKYAHVTYFFNGGREDPFEGEDRILLPSPRDVPTYDLKPEMSAVAVTDRLLEALDLEAYAFILVNYANPDMLGHTGMIPACVRAVEVVDACLDRLRTAILSRGGSLLVTADHGNIECLRDPESGSPHTAHTTNPVPLWWIVDPAEGCSLEDGGLADLAPSLCELLGLEPDPKMSGRKLLRCEPHSSN
ncbi:MAG: 2,3-bisphosphoglycerate-independent phosphoglycerate mutase [Myxococcales bacterium]|nr:2,3-bisphosphoglycerate-independent phosphoglycerate mutase [Myxococcales bacterium]